MKLSNSKSYKLFTVIIAISILPGCVSDTGADDGGFPYPEDLSISFESRPSSNFTLGEISTDEPIPDGTLEVIFTINSNSTFCKRDSGIDECQVSGGSWSSDSFVVTTNFEIETCYSNCSIHIDIYYLGKLIESTTGINF